MQRSSRLTAVVCALLLLIGFADLAAQVRFYVPLHLSYADAGVKLRIEGSGVYGVRGMTAAVDGFTLRTETSALSYRVGSGEDAPAIQADSAASLTSDTKSDEPLPASVFADGMAMRLRLNDGVIESERKLTGRVTVQGKRYLDVEVNVDGRRLSYVEEYPGTLAYGDLIGVDARGFLFIEVQTYLSEVPLHVRREVVVVAPDGQRCCRLALPMLRYCTTERDLQIDTTGRLFHLMTDEEGISVGCWSGLTGVRGTALPVPEQFRRSIHFNDIALTSEAPSAMALSKTTTASREQALHIAESYVTHAYTCASGNLSPVDVTAPDGDIVRTPSWLVVGRNLRIPYKWGGFNTLAQFDAGLSSGSYTGDINTAGVSSHAVGVDCSGFVSRCWQLSNHYSTASMPAITTTYATWDLLCPGDGILKAGHVRLFVDHMMNGALRVAESSGRDWSVSYWSYSPADLEGVYVPCRYNGMSTVSSTRYPEMLSVTIEGASHRLTWACDTTGVLGYRLYRSTDGVTWNRVLDETTLKTTTTDYGFSGAVNSYRVSSVMNSTEYPESNWSNAVTATSGSEEGKVLVVDGFNRETGSWRGPGHSFSARYGAALQQSGYSVETVERKLIDSGVVSLQPYRAVVWIAGDQSTLDTVINHRERMALSDYLEGGGLLFISGSEIGYALVEKGSAEGGAFLRDYLKASYVADNAATVNAAGTPASIFKDYPSIRFGQAYAEDYPDELAAAAGGTLCMTYSNGKGAGVCYSGTFGPSPLNGGVVYLGFPVETIADEQTFSGIISEAMTYMTTTDVWEDVSAFPREFELGQNYPNPFNPSTSIDFRLAIASNVRLSVTDLLGREVAVLVNEVKPAGVYTATWDAANMPSGVYLCRIVAGDFTRVRKLLLLK